MNKAEYIRELDKRLKYIPREDREDAIEYYTELMSDMGFDDKEDVTVKLGSAKEAARKILEDCTQKHVTEYEENKTVKGHATVVWLSVLGILSLPLSLPLAIVVLALAFTVIVVLVSLFLSFAATAVALILAGIACLFVMWFAPGFGHKAVTFGAGLLMLAIGTLLLIGCIYLVRAIFGKIFRRDHKKEETIL